ncbi:MAG: VWA domain-containing protein [Gemmatimonadetes bacterium]|nr:VWA domain-containing protein [Gemmatimonadota bacterium]MBK7783459.1 VWA domain-containing protein [Gemmatimonadota bacterium]
MSFDSPLLLLLAPLVAAAIGLVALLARRRRIARAAAWSAELGRLSRASGAMAPLLLALAGLAAGVGIAGPRGGHATVKAETQALSVVFVMDISRSMLAEDQAPSRLARAAREARRLVQDLDQDRVGLVAFAGQSYILSPLTLDGGAITLFLDALSPDLVSQGGTAMGRALRQGADLLNASREAGDRVLVVFTDGEAHDSLPDVLAAARALREQQIRLVLVAEGGTKPVPIPVRDSAGTLIEYKTDAQGAAVETFRRDPVLQQVADAAEGALVPAELPDQAGAVRELLSAFQRAPTTSSSTQDLLPLVWIPALLAALFLAVQTVSRRTAALVGLAALLCAGGLAAQRPAPGVRDYEAGRAAAAARQLQARLSPTASDTAFYNAGTALLGAGELPAAEQALAQAARSLDPELRYRALYNQGVVLLRRAAADSARRDSLLGEAADRLRQALTLEPASPRAKWNLELAQRQRTPPPSGGGNAPKPPPPRGQQPQNPQQGPARPPAGMPTLSPEQAQQILNSVTREERDTRARRLGRARPTPPTERDW